MMMIMSSSIDANHVYMKHPEWPSYAREAAGWIASASATFKSICCVLAQIIWGKKAKCLFLLHNKFNIMDIIRLFGMPPPPPPAEIPAPAMGVYQPKGRGGSD